MSTETQIPYLTTPGFPGRVYRFLLDEVDPRTEHRDQPPWPEWAMEEDACVCYRRPKSWQRGCPTTGLPTAQPWTPGGQR